MVMIFVLDGSYADTSDADCQAMIEYAKEKKALSEDMASFPIDHLAGHFALSDSLSASDDDYNAMEAAWAELLEKLGVTPEF